MNLRDLSEAIAGHARDLHPLSDTNVMGVSIEQGAVICDLDTSKLDDRISDLEIGEENLTKENKELKEANDALTKRAEAAEKLLNKIQGETEIDGTKGEALRHYVTLAQENQTRAERWQRLYEDSVRERDALRKRKGVTVNLFACGREILSLLGNIETYPDRREQWMPQLKALRGKLYVK